MTEDEAWQELERKQLSKKQKENEMKNKDLLFSHWYDSLEGTKSQGFAYKAWCAGWDASQKESTLQEISDIGQEIHTDHPMRHWDRTCPACVAEVEKKRGWVGLTDDEVHEAAIKCVKSGQSVNAAIRAIEAKLRERNT